MLTQNSVYIGMLRDCSLNLLSKTITAMNIYVSFRERIPHTCDYLQLCHVHVCVRTCTGIQVLLFGGHPVHCIRTAKPCLYLHTVVHVRYHYAPMQDRVLEVELINKVNVEP